MAPSARKNTSDDSLLEGNFRISNNRSDESHEAMVDVNNGLGLVSISFEENCIDFPKSSPAPKKKKNKTKRKGKKSASSGSFKRTSDPNDRRRNNSSMSFGSSSDDDDIDIVLAEVKQREAEGCPSPTSTAKFQSSPPSSSKPLPILRLAPSLIEDCTSPAQKRSAIVAAVAFHKRKQRSSGVRFGTATVLEMKRCISMDAVPAEGGFPLGICSECLSQSEWDLETGKRINYLGEIPPPSVMRIPERCSAEKKIVDHASRQSEAQRKVLLLPAMDPHYQAKELELERKILQKQSTGHQRPTTRLQTQTNQYHNVALEHHCTIVRNDLETIRTSRMEVGCKCHKDTKFLDHFDPLNTSQNLHKLMSDRKLRDEMRKRHILNPEEANGKISMELKRSMMARLKVVMDDEPCCRPDTCECAAAGISCHADACQCCSGKKHPTSSSAEACCGNPQGVNFVDVRDIRANRALIMESIHNQEISA